MDTNNIEPHHKLDNSDKRTKNFDNRNNSDNHPNYIAYKISDKHPCHPDYKKRTQRRNAREKKRIEGINSMMNVLKNKLPDEWQSRKMSKLEIIQKSTSYIKLLVDMVSSDVHVDDSDATYSYDRRLDESGHFEKMYDPTYLNFVQGSKNDIDSSRLRTDGDPVSLNTKAFPGVDIPVIASNVELFPLQTDKFLDNITFTSNQNKFVNTDDGRPKRGLVDTQINGRYSSFDDHGGTVSALPHQISFAEQCHYYEMGSDLL